MFDIISTWILPIIQKIYSNVNLNEYWPVILCRSKVIKQSFIMRKKTSDLKKGNIQRT